MPARRSCISEDIAATPPSLLKLNDHHLQQSNTRYERDITTTLNLQREPTMPIHILVQNPLLRDGCALVNSTYMAILAFLGVVTRLRVFNKPTKTKPKRMPKPDMPTTLSGRASTTNTVRRAKMTKSWLRRKITKQNANPRRRSHRHVDPTSVRMVHKHTTTWTTPSHLRDLWPPG